jgi:membrane associated rhomboid family serine protease
LLRRLLPPSLLLDGFCGNRIVYPLVVVLIAMRSLKQVLLLSAAQPRIFPINSQGPALPPLYVGHTMSSTNPPPPNPILSAYENFVRDTPLITRYVLTSQFITWFLSFFFDPSYASANIPHFTILKLELYRIVISPLVCPSLFSLIFAYLSFIDNGRQLEFSMGSTHFAWLLMTMGLVTNLSFLALSFALYAVSGNTLWLFGSSLGIWTILFGIIEIECVKAPPDSMRKLFFFTIPTIYYPLALCALFSLLGGFQFPYLLSIGAGYLYG